MGKVDAMEAGTEMDALVAEKVMEWTANPEEQAWSKPAAWGGETFASLYEDWKPSTDMAAAMEAVERMRSQGWAYAVTDGAQPGPHHHAEFYKEIEGQPRYWAVGEIPSLALCRAMLKAKGVE